MFGKVFREIVTAIGGGLGFVTFWATFIVGLEVCLDLLFLGFLSESLLVLAAAIVLAPLVAFATFAATWVAASVLHLAWHASVGVLNLAWQGIKGTANLLNKAWKGILNLIDSAKNRSTSSTTQNYAANPYGAQQPGFSEQQLTKMQEMLGQAYDEGCKVGYQAGLGDAQTCYNAGYQQGVNDAFAHMNSQQHGMYAQHGTPTDPREYQQPVTHAYAYQAEQIVRPRPSAPPQSSLYPNLRDLEQHNQATVYHYSHQ